MPDTSLAPVSPRQPSAPNRGSGKTWVSPGRVEQRWACPPRSKHADRRRCDPGSSALARSLYMVRRLARSAALSAAVSSRKPPGPSTTKKSNRILPWGVSSAAWIAGCADSSSMSLVITPCSSFSASSPATRTTPRSASSAILAPVEGLVMWARMWGARRPGSALPRPRGKRAGRMQAGRAQRPIPAPADATIAKRGSTSGDP